jgi:histidine triad (HIT) family protein
MPACVFCKIMAGEVAAQVVFADEDLYAILDHRPLFHGHVLLMPRAHVATLMDLAEPAVAPLFAAARRLAIAVERAMDAEGVFVGVNNRVSQSVPHLHVHVVPRRKGDGLRGFFWPRTTYGSEEQMADVAARIRNQLAVT